MQSKRVQRGGVWDCVIVSGGYIPHTCNIGIILHNPTPSGDFYIETLITNPL